jgi:hypothetical protein
MKVLKSFEFVERARSSKHDWDKLCDGSIRELTQGVDFAGKAKWFAVSCRLKAAKRGLRVRVQVDETKVVVQFFDPNAEQQEQPQQTTAKSKK